MIPVTARQTGGSRQRSDGWRSDGWRDRPDARVLAHYFDTGARRAAWAVLGLPAPGGTPFQLGFHVVVGLAMALLYGVALEARLPGRPWVKGALYAAGVWVANALIILPWLGEGFAGSRNLSAFGMAYFAAVHTVFFVLLAVLFAHFTRLRS